MAISAYECRHAGSLEQMTTQFIPFQVQIEIIMAVSTKKRMRKHFNKSAVLCNANNELLKYRGYGESGKFLRYRETIISQRHNCLMIALSVKCRRQMRRENSEK